MRVFPGQEGAAGTSGPDDYVMSLATDRFGQDIFLVGYTTSILDVSKDLHGMVWKINVGINFASRANFVAVGPEGVDRPFNYNLEQNYPNPFNPTTTIKFTLRQAGRVMLKVYDLIGREVKTLIDGEELGEGNHEVRLNGSDLSTGVYFYRIMTTDGKFHEVKKMMLVK